MTVLFAAGIGLGAASGGVAAGDAIVGSAALGLYAAAIVGIGVAVGGLWRTSLAAEIAALVVVATYLIDLIAPPLKLPDWVHQLALTAHLGQPMIGSWDPVGIVACARPRRRRHPPRRVGDGPARPHRLSCDLDEPDPRGAPTTPAHAYAPPDGVGSGGPVWRLVGPMMPEWT